MKKIAIIGALGLVGSKIRQVLEEEDIKGEFIFFDTLKNAGKCLKYNRKKYKVLELNEVNLYKTRPDFCLLAVPNPVSAVYAPLIAELGGVAIDNSSYFRMHENVPLIVPEVNAAELKGQIISNPNCSTIQAVVALAPLDKEFGLKRVVYSTYQAISGAGANAKFAYPIKNNLIPQIDIFQGEYTKEENKLIAETRKILGKPDLGVTATAVRVPIDNCHSITINAEFEREITPNSVREILDKADGVILMDEPENKVYPMPIYANEANDVLVGRIRTDSSHPNTINMFVVADNLRKGAATNAVQILNHMLNQV